MALPEKSPGELPKNVTTPVNSSKKSTDGGTKYNQAKIGSDFMVQKPIAGHTQKPNVDK